MTEMMLELSDFGSSSPKTKVSSNMKAFHMSTMFSRSLFRKANYPMIGTVADIGKQTALVNLHSTSRRPLVIATVPFSILWD